RAAPPSNGRPAHGPRRSRRSCSLPPDRALRRSGQDTGRFPHHPADPVRSPHQVYVRKGEEMMQIDHVVYGVQDLEAAAARFRERYGLLSVPGGVHPAWGTGNRIVPLGPSYIELLGVMDQDTASQSFLGRDLQARTANGDRLVGWCVRTDDLDATAARLGLE